MIGVALSLAPVANAQDRWSELSEDRWTSIDGEELRELTDLANNRSEIEKAASSGDTRAQILQAIAIYRGDWGAKADPRKATEMLRKFSDFSDLRGARILAQSLIAGEPAAADLAEAHRLLSELDRRGVASATSILGYMHAAGKHVGQDEQKAAQLYRLAADAGDKYGRDQLMYAVFNGTGTTQDKTAALALARIAADEGSGNGAALLAFAYENGSGVTKDEAQATKWHGRAHELGVTASSVQYALRLGQGTGIASDPARAIRIAEETASGGNTRAMELVGFFADHGIGGPVDPVRAFQWYEKAAKAGDVSAMVEVWKRYGAGAGVAKSLNLAQEWAGKAAQAGHAESMYMYGRTFISGTGTTKQPEEARKWVQMAANKGHPPAIELLAQMMAEGYGGDSDAATAFALRRKAADTGNVDAMRSVGFDLYSGKNGAPGKDEAAAAPYIKAAAEKGDAESMRLLAHFYRYENTPLQMDKALSSQWMAKAAEAGDPVAMGMYSTMLELGEGVARNRELSAQWAQKGHAAGNREASYRLARHYALGQGVPKDDVRATQLFGEAAEEGYTEAAYWYANRLSAGRGVPVDKVASARWFKVAADKGHVEASFNYAIRLAKGNGVAESDLDAIPYFENAITGFAKADDYKNLSEAADYMAESLNQIGRTQEALQASERSLAAARMTGDAVFEAKMFCHHPRFILFNDPFLVARDEESMLEWSKAGKWPDKSRQNSQLYGSGYYEAARQAAPFEEEWAADCAQRAAWALKVGDGPGNGAAADDWIAHSLMLESGKKYVRLGEREKAKTSYLEAARLAILAKAPTDPDWKTERMTDAMVFSTPLNRVCTTLWAGHRQGLYDARQYIREKDSKIYNACLDGRKYQ